MAHGLTRIQKNTLDFIRSYIASRGVSPSYAEIASGVQIGRSYAFNLVSALVERGYITTLPGKSRSIALREAAVQTTRAEDVLPPALRERLYRHAMLTGDTPLSIIIDAVTEHLDEAEPGVARHLQNEARAQ